MKKINYSRSYFEKYGTGHVNYNNLKINPTFKKIVNEIKYLGFKGKVLDIGCAKGFFLAECQKNNFEVYGVDISSYIVNHAKKFLKTNKIYKIDLTSEKLAFKNNYFDIVTMLDSLEHIENPQNALREAYRILKKGGLLHIRLPGFDRGLLEQSHVNFYNTKSLTTLLEKHNFQILKLGEEGGFLQIPLGLIRILLKQNTYFNYVPLGGIYISCYCKKI